MSSQLLTVVPKLAERLGDSHDNVRNAARQALLSSLDTLGASEFFRLLLPSLNSRKPLVKEGVSVCATRCSLCVVELYFLSICLLRRTETRNAHTDARLLSRRAPERSDRRSTAVVARASSRGSARRSHQA